MKGYKVFNENFRCRDFQFGLGQTYIHQGDVFLCKSGFHFCEKPVDCFSYYAFDPRNIVCEIEASDVSEERHKEDSKRVCGKITIVRQLEWKEVLDICNTGKDNTGYNNIGDGNAGNGNVGDYNRGNNNVGDGNYGACNTGNSNRGAFNSGNDNSGNKNTGNRNVGDFNTGSGNLGSSNTGYQNWGYWNTGSFNSGNRNAGSFNSCDYSYGFFCSRRPKPMAFNKEITHEEHLVYLTLDFIKLDPHILPYKDSWKKWWDESLEWHRERIKNLPNFDAKIFFEITGIDVSEEKTDE